MPSQASPGKRIWRFDTDSAVESSPTVFEGTVYFGNNGGTVFAVDCETRDEEWRFDTQGAVRGSLTVFGSAVYVSSEDGRVYELERDTGTEVWHYQTDGEITGSPVIFDLILYVGCSDGRLYALDLQERRCLWTFKTGGDILSSPVVAEGSVFVASTDQRLYAINSNRGELQWEFETNDEIQTAPTVGDHVVYVGDQSGTTYALSEETGEEIARLGNDDKTTESDGLPSPTALTTNGGMLYFGNEMGRIYATILQSEASGQVWKYEGFLNIQSAPTVTQNHVYVGDFRRVYALDRQSGTEEWVFETEGGNFRSAPTVVDGTLYIGNDDGGLYAIATDPDELSTGSRVLLGTLGHHERHAIFQTSTAINRHVSHDGNSSLERIKPMYEAIYTAFQ